MGNCWRRFFLFLPKNNNGNLGWRTVGVAYSKKRYQSYHFILYIDKLYRSTPPQDIDFYFYKYTHPTSPKNPTTHATSPSMRTMYLWLSSIFFTNSIHVCNYLVFASTMLQNCKNTYRIDHLEHLPESF
jgi:hypothetical protein